MVIIIIILHMAELNAIVAANISGIHTFLAVCGVVDPDNRNLIRTGEGLTSIADFGVFDSGRDLIDMEMSLKPHYERRPRQSQHVPHQKGTGFTMVD